VLALQYYTLPLLFPKRWIKENNFLTRRSAAIKHRCELVLLFIFFSEINNRTCTAYHYSAKLFRIN